jgi:hypothetical protein
MQVDPNRLDNIERDHKEEATSALKTGPETKCHKLIEYFNITDKISPSGKRSLKYSAVLKSGLAKGSLSRAERLVLASPMAPYKSTTFFFTWELTSTPQHDATGHTKVISIRRT